MDFDMFKYELDELMLIVAKLSDLCKARVTCRNGASVSIKFGPLYRSRPSFDLSAFDSDTLIFTAVEAGFPSENSVIPRSWLKYAEDRANLHTTVYNYLPCNLVIQFLEVNGGYVSGCLPPMKWHK